MRSSFCELREMAGVCAVLPVSDLDAVAEILNRDEQDDRDSKAAAYTFEPVHPIGEFECLEGIESNAIDKGEDEGKEDEVADAE